MKYCISNLSLHLSFPIFIFDSLDTVLDVRFLFNSGLDFINPPKYDSSSLESSFM